MKLLVLTSMLEHVRYRHRAEGLARTGLAVRALGFSREGYPSRPPAVPHEVLGTLHHLQYLRRVFVLKAAVRRVGAALRQADVVYAFGLDMALLARWAMRTTGVTLPLVYEVGDIRPILIGRGPRARCCRGVDAAIARHVDLLVVTSTAFLSGYYASIARVRPRASIAMENKVDPRQMGGWQRSDDQQQRHGPIRVGYFGVLRCRRSWEILKRAAAAGKGELRIVLRGVVATTPDLQRELQSVDHVEYGGPYLAPDDLPGVYHDIDLTWACYPYQPWQPGNWQWARTCRFYESCFFGRPLVAQSASQDGRFVERHGLGMTVDLADVDGAVSRLLSVSRSNLQQWRRAVGALSPSVYTLTSEYEELAAALNRLNIAPHRHDQ